MNRNKNYSNNNNLTVGIVIIIIGLVLLLKNLGIIFPIWFISWPMILILIGVALLVSNKNKSGSGVILVLLGSFFLLKKYFILPFELKPYLLPVGLIILGIYLVFKKRKENKMMAEFFLQNNSNTKKQVVDHAMDSENSQTATEDISFEEKILEPESIYANAFFTGINRRIFSKNFIGGKISAIFGGTDIDLTHADIKDTAVLDIEIAFGGVKLIVPSHWNVQINMGTVIAAGVEDKRYISPTGIDSKKILRIQGSMVFGGLEVKSI